VQNHYDQQDYICPNELSQKREFQDLRPSDLFSRRAWNFNEWSTREDSYRDVTVFPKRCGILKSDKNRYAGGTESHNY
jgi:hypothetical protein